MSLIRTSISHSRPRGQRQPRRLRLSACFRRQFEDVPIYVVNVSSDSVEDKLPLSFYLLNLDVRTYDRHGLTNGRSTVQKFGKILLTFPSSFSIQCITIVSNSFWGCGIDAQPLNRLRPGNTSILNWQQRRLFSLERQPD